jgi:hypothetical protein
MEKRCLDKSNGNQGRLDSFVYFLKNSTNGPIFSICKGVEPNN